MTAMADEDLAAAMLLGLESGLLSERDVVGAIDGEIAERAVAVPWLIDASLAGSRQGLMHALTEFVGRHPMLNEPVCVLDALEAAASRRLGNVEHHVSVALSLYPYTELPSDLRDLSWCLDVLATGEQGERAAADLAEQGEALHELLAAARGRSRWRQVVEQLLAKVAERQGS
jgi:hypothetical protein